MAARKRKFDESSTARKTKQDKKTTPTTSNVAPTQASNSVSQPTIQDFPRGGALPLSALECRDVAEKASNDVLFNPLPTAAPLNSRSKRHKKRVKEPEADALSQVTKRRKSNVQGNTVNIVSDTPVKDVSSDISQVDEDEKVNEGQMHATWRDVGSHDEDQNGTIEGEETSECSVDDSRMALDGAADDQDEKMQNAEHQNEPAPVVSQSNPFLAKLAGVEALEVDGSSFNGMMPMSDDGRQGKQHVPSEDEDDDDKDSTTTSNKTSSTKKDSKRLKKEREEAISRQERLLLDPDRQPETVEDYERLLLGSPNSSLLWIQEEGEKMNVWVAYLNLENKFGTQESLNKVFERGVAYNDPKTMYLQMARVYERTDKVELADELYTTILKKFKESSKCWTSVALFYLRSSRIEDARRLLQRCLLSLPKHKHVKTISKFAQMEFRHGDPERGRTIIEGI
ncbi:hypothetical protein SeLEV6574_g01820, partial [Synchytrium endobioticum]